MQAELAAAAERAQKLGCGQIFGVRENLVRAGAFQQVIELLRAAAEPVHAGIDVDRDGQAGELRRLRPAGDRRTQSQFAVLGGISLGRPQHQPWSPDLARLLDHEIGELVGDRLERFRHGHRPQPVGVGLDDGDQWDAGLGTNFFRRSSDAIEIDCHVDVLRTHASLTTPRPLTADFLSIYATCAPTNNTSVRRNAGALQCARHRSPARLARYRLNPVAQQCPSAVWRGRWRGR